MVIRTIKRKLIVPAGIGFIIFFPWRFSNGRTCIMDKLVSDKINYMSGSENIEQMRNRYMVPFGLLWWFCGGIIISELANVKRKSKVKENVER